MKREWKPYRIVRAEAICGERSGPRSGRSAFSKNRPSETRQTPDVDVWRWWCARHDDTTTRAPLYTMCPRTLLWCAHPFQTFICMNIRYQESLRNTYTHVQTQIVRTHILLLVLYTLYGSGGGFVCVCVLWWVMVVRGVCGSGKRWRRRHDVILVFNMSNECLLDTRANISKLAADGRSSTHAQIHNKH